MRKTVLALVSGLALLLGACGQIQLPVPLPTAGTGPTVDAAATSDASFQTAVAQTLTAQPTLPSGPATDTATPVASPVLSNTDTATAVLSTSDTPAAVPTSTPLVDQTSIAGTATSNFPTATSLPSNLLTATLAMGQVTASPTLGIRTYGTLPPAVPFSSTLRIMCTTRNAVSGRTTRGGLAECCSSVFCFSSATDRTVTGSTFRPMLASTL